MHRFRDGKHATYVDVARTFSRKLSAVVVARCKTADDTLRHLNRGPACCAFSFLEVDSTLVGLAVVVDDEEEEEEEEDNDDEATWTARLRPALLGNYFSSGIVREDRWYKSAHQPSLPTVFFSFLFFSQRFNTSATNL